MNKIRFPYRILILGLLVVTLAGAGFLALTNPQIPRYTLGPSGQSSGDGYTLSGTFGQHDASYLSTGGDYTLLGGFWGGVSGSIAYSSWLYLPIEKR